jgi:hypothetical protein
MKNKSLFVIGPHHYCHSTAALIEGLNKLGTMKVFSNANHNYCKHPVFNLDTQIKVAKMADYVLLAHSALEEKYKNKIQPLVDEVKDKIDIFLDGSDYFHYEDNPDKYKLYLKRELDSTKLNGNHNNVKPFIFASEDRHFTKTLNASHYNLWRCKTDDLVCIMSACEKRPWRFDIMKSLQDAFGHSDKAFIGEYREGENATIDTGDRHHSGYFNKLLNASISVDSYGCAEARQTGRFWESLANGCLVFYQPIEPYVWPHSYVDGEDFIVYNDNDELIEKAKYYIDNPNKAKKIAERGFTKLLQYHTTERRATQFCELVDEYL